MFYRSDIRVRVKYPEREEKASEKDSAFHYKYFVLFPT